MNIRGIFLHRLGKQGVYQADNGGIILAFQQIFGFRQRLRHLEQVHIITQPLHHLHGLVGTLLIGGSQQRFELALIDLTQLQRARQKAPQLDQRPGVGGRA